MRGDRLRPPCGTAPARYDHPGRESRHLRSARKSESHFFVS
jgi:hypothetical protein